MPIIAFTLHPSYFIAILYVNGTFSVYSITFS